MTLMIVKLSHWNGIFQSSFGVGIELYSADNDFDCQLFSLQESGWGEVNSTRRYRGWAMNWVENEMSRWQQSTEREREEWCGGWMVTKMSSQKAIFPAYCCRLQLTSRLFSLTAMLSAHSDLPLFVFHASQGWCTSTNSQQPLITLGGESIEVECADKRCCVAP